MDIVQTLIDLVLSLLGQAPKKPALAKKGAPARASAAGALKGAELLEGAEHVRVSSGEVQVQRDGAAMIRDDHDGRLVWVDQVDKSMPRARYADVWGPLAGPTDAALVDFCLHELVFTMEMTADARSAERKLQGFGYADAGQFYRVRATVLKHFATPQGPTLDDSVLDSQRYANANMKAQRRMHDVNQAAAMQADPALTAPIHGVTIERYAQISAKCAAGLDKAQVAALLAAEGLDQATFERVSAGWTERMQKDTSFALVTVYGKAFQAGQGGAAAAYAATGYDGTAAKGPEPMPFDQVCEVQGACSAWAKSGQDVNANLKKRFGLTAAEFSAAHSWWLSQLTSDLARFSEYNAKIEAAERKYAAGRPARPDADLSF